MLREVLAKIWYVFENLVLGILIFGSLFVTHSHCFVMLFVANYVMTNGLILSLYKFLKYLKQNLHQEKLHSASLYKTG